MCEKQQGPVYFFGAVFKTVNQIALVVSLRPEIAAFAFRCMGFSPVDVPTIRIGPLNGVGCFTSKTSFTFFDVGPLGSDLTDVTVTPWGKPVAMISISAANRFGRTTVTGISNDLPGVRVKTSEATVSEKSGF